MLEVKKMYLSQSLKKTFSILGKKWTGLIIEVLMDGDKTIQGIGRADT